MRIAQLSDIHVLDSRFEEYLLEATLCEINEARPDLVVVAGDLTAGGFRDQFDYAYERLSHLECPDVCYVPGNHDVKDAGYLHFEDTFGPRSQVRTIETDEGSVRVVCVDSTKPDLDEGEVGRQTYGWITQAFHDEPGACARIFLQHHHLVAVPGTGRDRNTVADAGDVLELLKSLDVDLVLAGHRHVPHVWPIAGMFIVHSGTAATRRVRGYAQPSYNLVTLTEALLEVEVRVPAGNRELLARHERQRRERGDVTIDTSKTVPSEATDAERTTPQTAGPRVRPPP